MYTHIQAAVQALYVIVAFNLLFMAVIYAVKLRNIRRSKLNERFQTKFKIYLTYVQANLEGAEPLRVPPWTMNPVEREAMQEKLNDMIEMFSGEQRHKLARLCRDLGLVQRQLERFNSRMYRVKLDAAYHLGCMRVKEAAPGLLAMLKEHPLNSARYVVARAAAKCAGSRQELEALVQTLLERDKMGYALIVDMIADSDVDAGPLYTDYLGHEQPAYVRVGLIGLTGYTDPAVASAVFRLLDSRHEDIQCKAVDLYLQSSRLLPGNVVSKLLSHPHLDIRRLTIEALAELKSPVYVEMLKAALGDADQRIVHASAKGLLRMGELGMTALCERAAAAQGTERGQFILQIIDDEIKQLSMQLHHWDKLMQYNTLTYTYDKLFRKSKRIYRVV
ncbi:hypothetical protein B5M42_012610 [Paenibacillus athensensis]|uniref:HEAT repeat domain-containing protein n=1 Tax=Paenibacillus athensensis TaxID=1967502 RepID=A0A4Y8Q0Q5_9BACL|nr:HEAT repeat domain-containing protein [Paenibacillus athensensis]MCD1259675.1 hypothetical protein [Paenibacillus athensensis]